MVASHFADFMRRVRREASGECTRKWLGSLALELADLAANADLTGFRPAIEGEELLYDLDVDESGGPSLYIVSDGVGVVSPPHQHTTWAVIVGVEGAELNQIYRLREGNVRAVSQVRVQTIRRGEHIVMLPDEIHGTVSVGDTATYHLHLYGRSLRSLSSFPSRTFPVVVPVSAGSN